MDTKRSVSSFSPLQSSLRIVTKWSSVKASYSSCFSTASKLFLTFSNFFRRFRTREFCGFSGPVYTNSRTGSTRGRQTNSSIGFQLIPMDFNAFCWIRACSKGTWRSNQHFGFWKQSKLLTQKSVSSNYAGDAFSKFTTASNRGSSNRECLIKSF